MSMPGKKGSGLHHSEKEHTEQRSAVFHHKNTPECGSLSESDVYNCRVTESHV
jgi:hypothetical protein